MAKIGDIINEATLCDLRKYSMLKYLGRLIEKYNYQQVKTPEQLKAFIDEVDAITKIHKD
jgi:hypothetical protein